MGQESKSLSKFYKIVNDKKVSIFQKSLEILFSNGLDFFTRKKFLTSENPAFSKEIQEV
jgi:hypothetical protein